MKYVSIIALFLLPALSMAQQGQDVFLLQQRLLDNGNNSIELPETWKYSIGDDFDWTNPGFNDSTWSTISTRLPASLSDNDLDWQEIGWFRMRIKVDSSLINVPLGFLFTLHNGASELYVNGNLLLEQGTVSRFEDNHAAFHNPNPVAITFQDTTEHVVSIRFNNHRIPEFHKAGLEAGFALQLVDINEYMSAPENTSSSLIENVYEGGLLIFALIHFLLFAFYPSENKNLLLAFISFALVVFAYAIHPLEYARNPNMLITFHTVGVLSWFGIVMIVMHFFQTLIYEKTPGYFWIVAGVGVAVILVDLANLQGKAIYRLVFEVFLVGELVRTLFVARSQRKQGLAPLAIAIIGLTGFAVGYYFTNAGSVPLYPLLSSHYGTFIFVASISIYLSSSFAKAQKKLEYKLLEVQYLSDRSLEQERTNKKKEIENKLLEVENTRKTEELEEARTLQLSMLPKELPESEFYDIAAYMDTAQEVGGDYYDFNVSQEGVMTAALGDATGHGMKAGILVATAKSYFHTLVAQNGNVDIIKKMSSGIQNMNLKMMYMGLTLARCKGHSIQYLSAGMPPSIWYKKETDSIEEVLVKAMPLGTNIDFPYQELSFEMSSGDVFVLVSDGLMELFNSKREQLGMERIGDVVKANASKSSEDILASIKALMNDWLGECRHEDDVTIMILKAK